MNESFRVYFKRSELYKNHICKLTKRIKSFLIEPSIREVGLGVILKAFFFKSSFCYIIFNFKKWKGKKRQYSWTMKEEMSKRRAWNLTDRTDFTGKWAHHPYNRLSRIAVKNLEKGSSGPSVSLVIRSQAQPKFKHYPERGRVSMPVFPELREVCQISTDLSCWRCRTLGK